MSRTLAGENGILNITLRGPSLTGDVNVMLTPVNGYGLDYLIEAIEKVLQSNADILTDQSLELTVAIARNTRLSPSKYGIWPMRLLRRIGCTCSHLLIGQIISALPCV